jgi:exopolyphosphatase / guanosine-5'-triphosphate,3'-diphosphate pyrophosphatase
MPELTSAVGAPAPIPGPPKRRRGPGVRLDIADDHYGALDLGTNNCRLLIAKPTRQGFKVVDAFSRIVRLGEGMLDSGRLSDAAQDRAVAALKICADKLERRQVRMTRHVATEACRRASNCQDFVARVYEETGLHLDVITPAEEARLAVLGCQALVDPHAKYTLVFDIGGGSTEISLVTQSAKPSVVAWTSVPWGVVSLSEAHGDIADPAQRYAAMRAKVSAHLSKFAARPEVGAVMAGSGVQVIGTSGTVTTLASLHLGLPVYDRRRVDGSDVPAASLHALSDRLSSQTPTERMAEPCIGKERADLVVPGCAILQAILACWNVDMIRVADRGIREGVLRTLMHHDGHRL